MANIHGWIKDKRDERDFLIRAVKPELIPDKIDLSEHLPTVRNQGNQGSCVGYGIGGIVTGKAIQVKVFKEWFSPRWIYYGGRFLGGYVHEDCGTEPRLALDWLIKYGCALESVWKYQERFDPEPPTQTVFNEAKKYPLFSYTRVVDGVDGICTALSLGSLVAIGSPWFSKWITTDDNGKLKTIYCWDSIAGGHETLLYGYDKTTEYYNGLNSWGSKWGNEGRFLMPFSAITQFKKKTRGGYDSHTISVDWMKV